MVKKGTIEKFGLRAIADALEGSDVATARVALSFAIGATVDVSGTVQKRVKREGQCRLVIEPGDVPGFVVFADCLEDAETVIKRKIRKGSSVRVKGKLRTFGASAVCLSDCRLKEITKTEQRPTQRKGSEKTDKTDTYKKKNENQK
jgi:hypothetical protein